LKLDLPPYPKSKTIAEKVAWDFIEKEGEGLELTVINPVLVLGPVLSSDFSASIDFIKVCKSSYLNLSFFFC
jgi:dihydroflavonol-4-reductase